MAEILIRGMEMPKRCDDCWALDDSGDYPYCRITHDQRGYTFNTREKRMDSCPFVHLPEGHGRLGDLDKINASLEAMIEIEHNQNAAPFSWSYAYSEMQSILDDAPTIVPAEGGGKDV